MGTYGSEFINIGEEIANHTEFRGLSDDAGRSLFWLWFQRVINGLESGNRDSGTFTVAGTFPPGGYVYFPPGSYVLPEVMPPSFQGIAITPSVTAIFAPGAVITLPSRADPNVPDLHKSIIVQGSIQAGLHQIVTAAYDPPVRGVPFALPVRHSIIFDSDRVKEVYPEWFGAQSKDGNVPMQDAYFDSFPGLQSAIDATINDNGPHFAPIPLVLTGRYQTTRPLYIGTRPLTTAVPFPGPFILRGRTGPSAGTNGVGTLSAHPDYELPPAAADALTVSLADFSLLIIRGPKGFLVEDMNFNAVVGDGRDLTFKAFSCVRVERVSGDSQLDRFRRCDFRNALGVLVQLGDFLHPYLTDLSVVYVKDGAQDLLGLVFEGCSFQQQVLPPENDAVLATWQHDSADQQWLRDGVYVRANQAGRVHFQNCWWRGMMRAGIRTYGGSITLTNCIFHITRLPIPNAVGLAQDGRYSGLGSDMQSAEAPEAAALRHSDETPPTTHAGVAVTGVVTDARDNGCDIYVEWFGRFHGTDGPATEPSTAVFVQGADSQSWRFLASYPASNLTMGTTTPNYDVQLENVNVAASFGEVPVFQGDPGPNLIRLPPSIEWLGPYTAGGSILVNGMNLGLVGDPPSANEAGHIYVSTRSSRIVIGQQMWTGATSIARVIDLGTRTIAGYPPSVGGNPAAATLFQLGSQEVPIGSAFELTRERPWYLNLQVPPSSRPG